MPMPMSVSVQVLRVFATQGVHRLAVVNVSSAKRVVGIITQSAVVRYLFKHMDILAPVSDVGMSQFLIRPATATATDGAATTTVDTAHSHIVLVPSTATAREVLQTVVEHKIWGVPIVDSDGAIVATFSVSDVRSLGSARSQADSDALLGLNVLEFLSNRRAAAASTAGGSASSLSPVTVQESDSVSMAVQLLAQSRLHQIYIVNAARQPIGVLALTDVIRALVWCMDAALE